MQYKSIELDYDESPDAELSEAASEGYRLAGVEEYRLAGVVPFAEEDDRGYSYKTRKIRYIMEKPDA